MADKTALIDVDILIYSVGYMSNEPDYPSYSAFNCLKGMIDSIIVNSKSTEFQLYLTSLDKTNFRYDLAKQAPYKGTRSKEKPQYYNALREYILDEFNNTTLVYNQEADDQIGIDQHTGRYGHSIICSLDKDLDMIPGQHYNWKKNKIYETSDPGYLILDKGRKKLLGGGYKWFYAQLLLGDTSDNIPGLAGFGPVRVGELLDSAKTEVDCLKVVATQYRDKYRDKAAILEILCEIGDLLWIRRTENQKKSIEIRQLWSQIC